MKILINAQGSRGDVEPMLALSKGLIEHGHKVILCASESYSNQAKYLDVQFFALGPDVDKMLEDKKDKMQNPLSSINVLFQGIRGSIAYYIEHLLSIVNEVGTVDMLLGGGVEFTGYIVADYLKIPYFYIAYCPQMYHSDYHPPFTIPYAKRPKVINRLLWHIDQFAVHHIIGLLKISNNYRKKLGLLPIQNINREMLRSSILAVDEPLGINPPHGGALIQTGYIQLEETMELPDSLEQFLSNGKAPIYIGFGSTKQKNNEDMENILIELCKSSNERYIIANSLIRRDKIHNFKNVYITGSVPYNKLFPRLLLVIHHGGAGTTHMAARSGIPQIIFPKAFDQFYWQERVISLGVGPRGISLNKIDTNKLITLIEKTMNDLSYRTQAQYLGEKLKKINGLKLTVEYLTDFKNNNEKNSI